MSTKSRFYKILSKYCEFSSLKILLSGGEDFDLDFLLWSSSAGEVKKNASPCQTSLRYLYTCIEKGYGA